LVLVYTPAEGLGYTPHGEPGEQCKKYLGTGSEVSSDPPCKGFIKSDE